MAERAKNAAAAGLDAESIGNVAGIIANECLAICGGDLTMTLNVLLTAAAAAAACDVDDNVIEMAAEVLKDKIRNMRASETDERAKLN